VQAKKCSQPDIADLDVENKRLRVVHKGGRHRPAALAVQFGPSLAKADRRP
jgi:hypothetical protein